MEIYKKKIDRFVKKQDILIPQAKSDLRADIQKDYDKLRKNGLELDKSYADKLKGIIKSNSNENVKWFMFEFLKKEENISLLFSKF